MHNRGTLSLQLLLPKKSLVCESLVILIMTVCWKSFFERTRAIIHSFWLWENDCVRLVVRLWVGPGFGVRVIIQAITHTEERGSRHGGWGVLLLGLKANGLCAGEPVRERERERERGGQSADSEVMGCLSSPLSHSRTCQSCRLAARAGSPPTCLSTPTSFSTHFKIQQISLSLPPSYFFLVISLEMTPHANGIQF